MATPKLNPSRSIAVIPSDYCNIPNPALLILDVAVSDAGVDDDGNYYIDVLGYDLNAYNVNAGDIIYNTTQGYGVTITSILNMPAPYPTYKFRIYYNATTLDVFTVDINIQIYSGQDDSTGCVLYVGTGGVLKATTEGGDEVVFVNVPTGSFLPVQVIKIGIEPEAENASNILALR